MSQRRKQFLEQWGGEAFGRLQSAYEKKSAVQAESSGEKLGILWYAIDRKHRDRAFSNLHMAFPEWSEAKVKSTAKGVFRHFGRVAGDFLRSPVRSNDEVLASVEQEGQEHLEAAANSGRGGILMTGHFGNWERHGQVSCALGHPLAVVARDANQAGVQEMLTKTREAVGLRVISRGNSVRQILQLLKQQGVVAIVADQNSDECFVPFFGHECGSVLGPAVLHQRTGAPIMMGVCVRIGPAKYRSIFYPLVDPENREQDPVKIMATLNRMLEEIIREYPEQWLWVHDRWKSARKRGLL